MAGHEIADVLRIRLAGGQVPSELSGLLKTHLADGGTLQLAQEGHDAFVHLTLADASALREALDLAGIEHRFVPPLRLDPKAFGFAPPTLTLLETLGAAGIVPAGLGGNVAADAAPSTGVPLEASQKDAAPCSRSEEVRSDYASGSATDVTIFDDVQPATIEAAINEAYASAAGAAATADSFLDHRSCAPPCETRYVLTFAAEATNTMTPLEVKVSASGQKAAIEVSASTGGALKTVTAWVRWTLWRVCLSGPEAAGTPSPSGSSGSVQVGSQVFTAHCPTRSQRGQVRDSDDWYWSIASPIEVFAPNDSDSPEKSIRNAAQALRRQLVQQSIDAAGKALAGLEICPSHCPTNGAVSMMIVQPVVSVENYQRTVGAVGYYYEARLVGSGAWAVFKPCCPPS